MNIGRLDISQKEHESSLSGTVSPMMLPERLTISKGQKFSDLMLFQYPRIKRFFENNAKYFRHLESSDWYEYSGPDAVIPRKIGTTNGYGYNSND